MAGINKVIVVGNLGRDPELRYTQSGTPVCNLAVATSRRYTNKSNNEVVEETEWHRIVVWGKQAEHCNNYLAKGRQVYVEGRLKTSSYDRDGQRHYSTDIIAETVQFLGGKGGQQNGNQNNGQQQQRSAPSQQRQISQGQDQGGPPPFEDNYMPSDPDDDDIPF